MAPRRNPRAPMGTHTHFSTHTHFNDDHGQHFNTAAPHTDTHALPSGEGHSESVSGHSHHGSVSGHSRQGSVTPYARAASVSGDSCRGSVGHVSRATSVRSSVSRQTTPRASMAPPNVYSFVREAVVEWANSDREPTPRAHSEAGTDYSTHSRATSRSRATDTPSDFNLLPDHNFPPNPRAPTPCGDLGDDWTSQVGERTPPPTPTSSRLGGLPEDFTWRPNPAVGIPGGPVVQRDFDQPEAITAAALSDEYATRLVCATVQQGPMVTYETTDDGLVPQQPPSTPGMFGPIRYMRASEGHSRVREDTARLYPSERFSDNRKTDFFIATGWELVQVPRYDGLSSYRQYTYHERASDVPQWILIAPTTHQVFALGTMTHSLTSDYVDLLDAWHKTSTQRKTNTMVLMNPKSDHARAAYLTGRPRSASPFWPDAADSRTLREDEGNALEIVLLIAKIVLRRDIPWGVASDGWRHFVVQSPAADGNVSISRSWGWEHEDKQLEPLDCMTQLTDEMFATMAEQFVNYAYVSVV